MWCSGIQWIFGQLEERGVGQSVMKLIQCSGLPWIYGSLEGDSSASISAKCGSVVFNASLLK